MRGGSLFTGFTDSGFSEWTLSEVCSCVQAISWSTTAQQYDWFGMPLRSFRNAINGRKRLLAPVASGPDFTESNLAHRRSGQF